jgi:chromosome transmission fidelity protein 4
MENGSVLRQSTPLLYVANGRETNAKVVNTVSSSRVMILRGHSKSVKHISFHPNGNLVTTSSSDGYIYVFSITSEEASLLKKIDGIIPAVDVESETASKVAWHPDGTVFAAPTSLKGNPFPSALTVDVQLVTMEGWEQGIVFKNGHTGPITDLAWSPNGVYLATSSTDGKVHIWQTKDQTILTTYTTP